MYYVRKVVHFVLGAIVVGVCLFVGLLWELGKSAGFWLVDRIEQWVEAASWRIVDLIDDIDPDRYRDSYSHVE